MALIDTRKLFDIVTRQSVFIEQVKADEALRFSAVLREIQEDFAKILPRIKYANLDALSKAQLNAFLLELKKSQTRIYSRYQRQLIARLQQFMVATTVQTAQTSASFYAHTDPKAPFELLSPEDSYKVIAAANEEEDNNLLGFLLLGGVLKAFIASGGSLTEVGDDKSYGSLWSKIKNSPLPSGGALTVNFINGAIGSALVNVENAVRKAWVNKQSVAELRVEVLGGSTTTTNAAGKTVETTTTGVLPKVKNTMDAVLATTLAHVAQQSISEANAALWPEYVWVSILDSHTSDICRHLNKKHWPYGKGPLPPAHIRCRSHTIPYKYWDSAFVMPTFFEWIKVQPESFISGAFGSTIASKAKDGTLVSADVAGLKTLKPKPIADYLKDSGDLL